MRILICVLFFLLTSCMSHRVQVTRLSVDRNSLASTFTRSPDPLQATPPSGEKLYINWTLPFSADPKDYHLVLSVIYKNLSEETQTYPLSHRVGFLSFPLTDKKYKDTQGFYAYKAELIDNEGKIHTTWQHQMWVSLIH